MDLLVLSEEMGECLEGAYGRAAIKCIIPDPGLPVRAGKGTLPFKLSGERMIVSIEMFCGLAGSGHGNMNEVCVSHSSWDEHG